MLGNLTQRKVPDRHKLLTDRPLWLHKLAAIHPLL
jgi:hypothetical protein